MRYLESLSSNWTKSNPPSFFYDESSDDDILLPPKMFRYSAFCAVSVVPNYLNPSVSLRNKRSWGGDSHVVRIVNITARYDRNLNKNERNFPIRQN